MRFLLDTNVISAYLRGNGRVFNRFVQYGGGLATSAICAGELYSWVLRAQARPERKAGLEDLMSFMQVLPFDGAAALEFGRVRAGLLDAGELVPTIDLAIACTALAHDLTLVTHNVKDFDRVPGLRLEDWLA